jgi:hypothetical protein
MIRAGAMVKALLLGGEFRLGISRTGNGCVHALVHANKKAHRTLISAGPGIPINARLLVPGLAYGDLGQSPVFLHSESLNGTALEAWIDANEAKIIPKGLTANAIVNEYAAYDGVVYSATVAKQVRDAAAKPSEPGVDFLSLTMPLWDLAKLHGARLSRRFVLWKISMTGSTFGFVERGLLSSIENCWIGCNDCEADPQRAADALSQAIRRVSGGAPGVEVAVFSPEPSFALPKGFTIPDHPFIDAPAISGLPTCCHEAAAHTWTGGKVEMDFLSLEKRREAGRRIRSANRLWSLLRICIWAFFASLLVLAGFDGAIRLVGRTYRQPMELLRAQEIIIKGAEKRRELLLRTLNDKAKFAVDRSRLTPLLSDFQTIFPENAWADGISVTGSVGGSYRVDIQALAQSGELIDEVLGNVRKLRGVSNAKLVNSEQTALPGNAKAIKFKITFDWHKE